MICSEIGSEGRNFQFCHRLILFDLPQHPEVLEQRIGRLDRIGQKNDIHIHVLYVQGTGQELLAKWYHDGLDAFRQPVSGAGKVYEELGNRVAALAAGWFARNDHDQLRRLIDDTRTAKERILDKMAAGRDRLLEWHSHQPEIGNSLVDEIEAIEAHSGLPAFMDDLCHHLGVHVEDHDHNSLFFLPGDYYQGLPGLPEEGIPVTFSRRRALTREDMTFLTWEHPMVVGGMDQLLGSWAGRAGYGVWEDPDSRTIYLETIFLVYCIAPGRLCPQRFLPPSPLRILVNHAGQDLSDEIGYEQLRRLLKDDPRATMLHKPEVKHQVLPVMIERCRQSAQKKKEVVIGLALANMRSTLDLEIGRLTALLAAEAPVREDEIEHLREERQRLDSYFLDAMIRLDSVRLIWRGPIV